MLLYFIRHGDPIYSPDGLTALGKKQAVALAKRLVKPGFDKIYTSTSNRAVQTAQPTCEALGIDPIRLEWCNEKYAADEFMVLDSKGEKNFLYTCDWCRKLFVSKEIESMGFEWYRHSAFADSKCEAGMQRILNESEIFLEKHGYRHDRKNRYFLPIRPNEERIAMFAHAGFGAAFLSCILDIPYPMFSVKFRMGHSTITVIELSGKEICVPQVLTLGNDSHLFFDHLPTKWCNTIEI